MNFAEYRIGDIAVIALRDGYVDLPSSRLRQPGNRRFERLPAEVALVNGQLRLSVNAFLVIDQGEHVLIDTGAANSWDPTMGLLLEALAEAGISRDDITTVALTHTHEDHAHGLVAADGSDAFPRLRTLLVPSEELALFDGIERLERFRSRRSGLESGAQISAHVTAIAAHGHELGHTAFAVSSGRERLLIWGDVIHVPSIQFAQPELSWGADANQDEARATRARLLELGSRSDTFAAGAHLDFPGVGKVTLQAQGFAFKPI